MGRPRRSTVLAAALAALALGCGASTQKAVIAPVLSNDAERRTAFEATTRLLDQHPEWVDDMYAIVRRHERARHRMLADAARDLANPRVADEAAALLAKDPRALYQVLVSAIAAARPVPPAREAMDRAVADQSVALGEVLAESPDAVRAMFVSTVAVAKDSPPARRAMGEAMAQTSVPLADITTDRGATLHAMMLATVDSAAKKPKARAALERAVAARAAVLAGMVAEDDAALGALLRATLEAVEQRPESHAALRDALLDERALLARLLEEDPRTLADIAQALVREWARDRREDVSSALQRILSRRSR